MTDSILDEVQALLDKEFGDKRILEQILRAAENNEVISNFERNYVRKLAEKHLGRKPPVEDKPPETPKQISPEVEIQSPLSSGQTQTAQILSPTPKVAKLKSKNNMIMIGVGIAVLAIIIIAAMSLGGNSDGTPNNVEPNQTSSTSNSFSIKIDSSSYNKGDIISINGKSNLPLGNQVNLSIENPDGALVWSEQINVNNDGNFSTLTFAGGVGWEKIGEFTIKAEGGSDLATHSFSFRG